MTSYFYTINNCLLVLSSILCICPPGIPSHRRNRLNLRRVQRKFAILCFCIFFVGLCGSNYELNEFFNTSFQARHRDAPFLIPVSVLDSVSVRISVRTDRNYSTCIAHYRFKVTDLVVLAYHSEGIRFE
jgi:hypothetical protein